MLSAICVDHLCSNLNVSGIDYICLVTVCNHSVPRIYSLWFDCTRLTPITWYLNHSNLDRTAWINKSSSVGNILQPHATNSMIFHMVSKKRTEMYFNSRKKKCIYRYVYIDDTNTPSIFYIISYLEQTLNTKKDLAIGHLQRRYQQKTKTDYGWIDYSRKTKNVFEYSSWTRIITCSI